MMYHGDFTAGTIVHIPWASFGADGASITRATNGTISVYKNAGTTQTTTGVTDTEDFDAVTGIHWVTVDTSADGTFYAAGNNFTVVLSGATIDGKTVNAVLGTFSIEYRKLVAVPSAATISSTVWAEATRTTTAGTITTVTGNVNGSVASVTGNVGGNVVGTVGTVNALAANVVNAAALATDAVTEVQSGLATSSSITALDAKIGTPSNLGGGATIAANLSDIESQTDDIGAAGAGLTGLPWNSAWDAEVQSEATDALNAYDPPTKAEMDARTLAAADYATGANLATVDTVVDTVAAGLIVVDALIDTLIAQLTANRTEPSAGAPPVSAPLAVKVDWLYALVRNAQTVTATEQQHYADDGTTPIAKRTLSDASGTLTRGEMVAP